MLGSILKLALLVAVVVLIGLAVFRPATLFGVDAKGLNNSLGGEVHHSEADCVDLGSGRWRCVLHGGTVEGVEYAVAIHDFGCWSATATVLPRSADPTERSVSGCIGLADEFGD